MQEYRDWYGRHWKLLRSQLIKICLAHGKELLESAKAGEKALVEETRTFVRRVSSAIADMVPADELGLWANALPLLVGVEWLCTELAGDREALLGLKQSHGRKIEPEQALARKLSQFFEMNRRNIVADDLGVSANKVKTWERLDRLSRNLNHDTENRCHEDHFEELARYVKKNHPADKNLPRRAKTVKGYFFRFSRDCVENIEDWGRSMEKLSLAEAKELMHEVGKAELLHCLQELEPEDMAIIDYAYNLQFGSVAYLSKRDFLQHNNISAERFLVRKGEVVNMLRQCLELSLSGKSGGAIS